MVGRPCKPDPDVNWLWRTLLPDMPSPSCGTPNDQLADCANEEPQRNSNEDQQNRQSWLRKLWPERARSRPKP
jgi:hypothetical protein